MVVATAPVVVANPRMVVATQPIFVANLLMVVANLLMVVANQLRVVANHLMVVAVLPIVVVSQLRAWQVACMSSNFIHDLRRLFPDAFESSRMGKQIRMFDEKVVFRPIASLRQVE